MSATIRRIVPLALCAIILGLSAASASAQSRDPLPEVRERLKIEAHRIEKEVRNGRMRAYRQLRSDPEGALDIIKDLIGMLRKDTSLSEARRKTLLTALQRDIDNVRVLSNLRRVDEPAAIAARREARRPATTEPPAAAGQRSTYDTASERIRSMSGRVAQARELRDKQADRFTGTLTRVDRAATPPRSDYDLPDDWLEKSRKRSPAAKLTEQEKKILEALKKPVEVDYNMATFQSVIDHLSKKMGVDIIVDKQALDEAAVTYDTPITLRFNKPVSARSALKRVLADVGLTYVIRREAIEVTTLARAREMMVVRTYYLGDLMGVANPMLPAIVNQFQMVQAIGIIINQIQSIEPESWEGRGGPGTVTFDPVRMVLIVKQSAEIHYAIDGLR
jgi:hypothetical protein